MLCDLTLHKPALAVKQVSYRKLKTIDISEFKSDLGESSLCRDVPQDLNKLVASYNSVCSGVWISTPQLLRKPSSIGPACRGLMTPSKLQNENAASTNAFGGLRAWNRIDWHLLRPGIVLTM